jgi:hypothetical protein
VGEDMGKISTAYWCETCVEIMADMYDAEDGLDYGDLREEAEQRRVEDATREGGGE